MAQDLAREFVADLYRRERSGMRRSVARIAGESHAEDLVHDAFVAYLVKSPWAEKPGAWVSTVARNRALNELRRPKLYPLSGIEPGPQQESPDAEREAVRTTVASALEKLPERSLTALRMKFFEGADYPEIARALSVRVPQAHVIVHRALRRLGRELVHAMAAAHGASGCAPALARMAGLGGGDDAHSAEPCPVCRPAWDEIVALRIGAWIPAPLLAFRSRIRSLFESFAGRVTGRGPLAAESANWAATALVALGVATASLAPAAATVPSVSQRANSSVVRPAAGTGLVAPGAAKQIGAKADATAPVRGSGATPREPGGVRAPNTRAVPPQGDDPGEVGNDDTGSTILICPDPTQPCKPPPPGGARP